MWACHKLFISKRVTEYERGNGTLWRHKFSCLSKPVVRSFCIPPPYPEVVCSDFAAAPMIGVSVCCCAPSIVSFFALSSFILALIPSLLPGFSVRPSVVFVPSGIYVWAIVQWALLTRACHRSRLTPLTISMYRYAAMVAAITTFAFAILMTVATILRPQMLDQILGPGNSRYPLVGSIMMMGYSTSCLYMGGAVGMHLYALRGAEKSIAEDSNGYALS